MISRKHAGFRIIFKLVSKKIFEQSYNFCVLSIIVFVAYNQNLQRERSFISFCVFNYVTYITCHSYNPFVGKFRSSRKKLVTSTILSAFKAQKMEEACKVDHQKTAKEFSGLKNFARCKNLVTSSLKVKPNNFV